MAKGKKNIQDVGKIDELLQTIADASPVGIIIFDSDARVIHANAIAEQFFGQSGYAPKRYKCGDFIGCVHRHLDPQGCGHTDQCSLCPLSCAIRATLEGEANSAVLEGEALIEREPDHPNLWVKFKTKAVKMKRLATVVMAIEDITAYKQADAELRESERRYRRIVENISDVVWIADLDLNNIYVSQSIERMMGEPVAAYMKKPIEKRFSPESLNKVHAILLEELAKEKDPNMDKGRTRLVELEHYRADGSTMWVSMNVSFLRDDNGNPVGIQGVTRDINERKRAEEELKLNERCMATLLKLSQMVDQPVNIVTDFALERAVEITGSRIGYFAFVNEDETVMTMYSWSQEAMKECKASDKPREYPVAATGLWGEAVRQRKPIVTNKYEAPNHMKKGSPDGHVPIHRHMNIPLLDEGRIVLVAGVGNKKEPYDDGDVQALTLLMDGLWKMLKAKREAMALRESENRFHKSFVFNPAPMVISEIDTALYIDVNDHWVEMLGYTRQEILGRRSLAIGVYADFGERERIVSKLRDQGRFKDEPIELINKSRQSIFALWSAEVITLSGQKVMLSLYYDETERKQSEKDKEKLHKQLLQAQKMEAVGRLAGGVAHDHNNMLSIIIGYTELVMGKVQPDDPLYADLQEVLSAAKRSTGITRQLLAFARQQTISPRKVDLNEILESMLKMLRRLIGEDIDIKWHPGKKLWPVNVDPTQIDQILANLCVNAQDAIAGVGKVTIETNNTAFDEVYCATHEGFVPGEFVLLAVSDDGSGMDKETLEKIFEPFFTTKGIGKGTGLGLATIYGIVKQNNGFINVYSEPGKGTTFRIYLPRHVGQGEETDLPREATILESRGETVLLVEDEPVILKMGRTMLEKLGYQVFATGTPKEAIHLAQKHDGEIDLLITDVVMPEMNGRELSEQLRAQYPGLKTVFMSGYTSNVIAHRGILEKDVVFIQKPFSIQDLATKIQEALALTIKSQTSGRAGGLKNVNRSKRLIQWPPKRRRLLT